MIKLLRIAAAVVLTLLTAFMAIVWPSMTVAYHVCYALTVASVFWGAVELWYRGLA